MHTDTVETVQLYGPNTQMVGGGVAILFNIFGVYVILFQSPKNMHNYKYILLGLLTTAFIFDFSVTALSAPAPLPNAIGCQMLGVLAKLMPKGGNIIMTYFMTVMILEVSANVYGFLYREHILLKSNEKQRDKIIRYIQIVSFLSFALISTPIFTYLFSVPDGPTRIYLEEIGSQTIPGAAICLINPQETFAMTFLFYLCIAFIVLYVGSIIRAIFRINSFLKQNEASLSDYSIRLQKMLLSALIWQSVIPLSLLILPTFGVYLFIALNGIVFELRNEVGQYLTAISFITPSLYSPAHVISMTYFTTPYRNFCKKMLGFQKIAASSRSTVLVSGKS